MKLSVSAGYGLVTVLYIAKKGTIVLSQEISDQCSIPIDYLLKILSQLVRAGILYSKRGPNGGFTLASPPSEISYLNIVEAIDGYGDFHIPLQKESLKELTEEIEKVCGKALKSFQDVLRNASLANTLNSV